METIGIIGVILGLYIIDIGVVLGIMENSSGNYSYPRERNLSPWMPSDSTDNPAPKFRLSLLSYTPNIP